MRSSTVLYCVGLLLGCPTAGAADSWQLWASGLPAGSHPRLAIAADHTIYFALLAGPPPAGVVYQATNALAPGGSFNPMPPIPYVSLTNNVQALTSNAASEPVVGIFHGSNAAQLNDPIAFVYDRGLQQWQSAVLTSPAGLGVFSMASAANGDVWFGAKWSRVYRSSDGGRHYTAIDESARVAASAPCYYPTFNGNGSDGAIYSINIDRRGYVYAGTEGAGVVYSSDRGNSWQPVDAFACLPGNPLQHNPSSPMAPATRTGNVGAIGFTADHHVLWNGTSLFAFPGWTSALGHADPVAQTVQPSSGLPDYFLVYGLQTSRIVTTASGTLFLHSGANPAANPNPPPPPQPNQHSLGIFRSEDGLHWTAFNTGISSTNDGASEGALAVDGDRVFTATADGKVWFLDVDGPLFGDDFEG